jgi:NAD(P)-dependent dehydrogenase (short-subunit alcohol dehydrogenase family)
VDKLAGKVALVTGGGSGIGRGLVLELARRGMKVAVSDIDPKRAEAVAEEARTLGVEAAGFDCDVSERAAVREMAGEAAGRLGAVALLCANAGVTAFQPFAEMADADLDWIYGVDFLGVSNCLQAVLPGMLAAGEGHVFATASMAGLVPSWVPIHVPYTASKAGVIGMFVNLQPELADKNIGCTVLCPGGVATNITQAPSYRGARFGGPSSEPIKTPAGFKLKSEASYPMRTAEDVARIAVEAIVANRLIVVADGAMRPLYERYAEEVLAAFDWTTALDAAT